MEVSIFPLPEVRALKSRFVEARLHADTKVDVLKARIAGLVETVARAAAQPIYVAMDPATEKELGRFGRAVLASESDKFVMFLEAMVNELH